MSSVLTSQQAFQQLLKQPNHYESSLHVNSALIGADFLGTTVRAWPQFFFAYVLPFPILQAASFFIAAGLWVRRARQYHLENAVLTDEFIISFKVLKEKCQTNSGFSAEILAIEAAINELLDKDENKKRKDAIANFLGNESNKEEVITKLTSSGDSSEEKGSGSQGQASQIWASGFNIVFQYAVSHWVLWMTITLFYYAKDRLEFSNWDGVNDEYHEDVGNDPCSTPGVFENDTMAMVQFVLPALLVIGAHLYNSYYKDEKDKQDAFTQKQVGVRAQYLAYKNSLPSNVDNSDRTAETETSPLLTVSSTKSSFFNSERWVVILSMGTSFWSAFLLANLMAWPITGALNRLYATNTKGDDGLGSEITIMTTFSIVMLASFANMYFKYLDMQKELADAKCSGVTFDTQWHPNQSFIDYYSQNPRLVLYIILDRFSGSGGILAIRMIFIGGIGGYAWNNHDTDGMDHIKEVMPIAVTAMVLMIALNLYQTYYAAQREAALKDHHDGALVQRRSSVAVNS